MDATRSIGVATLREDGLLEVMLRAESSSGSPVVGDAMFVYKKQDPQYNDYIRHVGGLTKGETKEIPPWK
jgi:hypothetical protein